MVNNKPTLSIKYEDKETDSKESTPLLKRIFFGGSSSKKEKNTMSTNNVNDETTTPASSLHYDEEEAGGGGSGFEIDTSNSNNDGVGKISYYSSASSSGDEFGDEEHNAAIERLPVKIGSEADMVKTMRPYRQPSFKEQMKLQKKGMPIILFKLIKAMSCLSIDCWILLPIWAFLIIMGLLGLIAITEDERYDLTIYVVCGVLGTSCLIFLLKRLQYIPSIPHEDEVPTDILISNPSSWPTAPIAPVRGELIANKGQWFRDSHGRRLLLRGVNCSGHCKLPTLPTSLSGGTHCGIDDMFKITSKGISFVGRPFPLNEANMHLGRLRSMGYTFLRLLYTWEAVEHDGPGIYDEEYLQYLKEIVQCCSKHGISVFVDAHQDVWSRFTGGDGAPSWTLEKVGFQLDKLDESGAAMTQQKWHSIEPDKPYPTMVWNSNNSRLAAGTMWTLFFAGNDFAPNTYVDGEPIQDYLQRHFVNMLAKVAHTLKDEANVVGFDILNEPSVGFVGVEDVRDIGPNQYFIGYRVDTWTAIKMGVGIQGKVDYFSSFMILERGKRKLNVNGACSWIDGPENGCIWKQNGVWDYDPGTGKPRLLKPNYFSKNPTTGKEINFEHDYTIPFWKKCSKAIRQHMTDAIIFAEPVLDMCNTNIKEQPVLSDDEVGAGYVWAKHYYDGLTLLTKHYKKFVGLDAATEKQYFFNDRIERGYGEGILTYLEEAKKMGSRGSPVLVGEIGIPFDLEHERSKRTDFHDLHVCTHALNRSMSALEYAQVSFTLWTYAPDNTNKYGDNWNGEDLSIFSKDHVNIGEEDYLYGGGRSLAAAIRPYPTRIAGDVIRYHFNPYRKDKMFELIFDADHTLSTTCETEIFIPRYQYPFGVNVNVLEGDGTYSIDLDKQTLLYHHKPGSTVNIIAITKKQSLMHEIF